MSHFFSKNTQHLSLSPLQIALKNTSTKDIIPFSLGMPDNNLLKCIPWHTLIHQDMDLQYKPPSDHLKKHIKKLVTFQHINCHTNQIFLTNGAQQAITLLLNLLCDPGDTILTEDVTYPGLIQAAQTHNLKCHPIKTSPTGGIDINALEKEILKAQSKPKLLYVIPNGHNPLSLSLNLQTRKELIKIAQKYNLPILEDDAYGFLSYHKQLPSLHSLEPSLVTYIGTFSKILGPALRSGWIICPPNWIEKLEILKEAMDINTQTLSQILISRFMDLYSIEQHILTLQKTYQSKRDSLIKHLNHHIPDLKFIAPTHGFFIWGTFEREINTMNLFNKAMNDYGVSFIPGASFKINETFDQSLQQSLRLSFSYVPQDQFEEGIIRLKKAINSL